MSLSISFFSLSYLVINIAVVWPNVERCTRFRTERVTLLLHPLLGDQQCIAAAFCASRNSLRRPLRFKLFLYSFKGTAGAFSTLLSTFSSHAIFGTHLKASFTPPISSCTGQCPRKSRKNATSPTGGNAAWRRDDVFILYPTLEMSLAMRRLSFHYTPHKPH